MKWRRRIKQWIIVLRLSREHGVKIPWFGMIRMLLSGVVPRQVWRQRMRTCANCFVYDMENRRCSGAYSTGCSCYTPFLALTPAPYRGNAGVGCWLRAVDGVGGWPEYVFKSKIARLWSFVRFCCRK